LDRASRGNSQQAQLQKLWRKQTPAAKALLRSNPIERLVQRNVFFRRGIEVYSRVTPSFHPAKRKMFMLTDDQR
jgi:hypothetical protein